MYRIEHQSLVFLRGKIQATFIHTLLRNPTVPNTNPSLTCHKLSLIITWHFAWMKIFSLTALFAHFVNLPSISDISYSNYLE